MITRHGIKKIVRTLLVTLGVLIVVGYGIFAFHDLLLGPDIVVLEPKNGSSFTSPSIKIKGIVYRIQDITLNDRHITIDDKGNFSEPALLAPGYNVFTLTAHDKFGRSKDYRLELVYTVN